MLVRPIACALLLLGIAQGARAAVAPPEANVQCAFAPGGGTFYLGAGHDRCWGPINGKTMAPKFMLACAVKREDGSLGSVSFIFSEVAVSECNNGQPATKDQYTKLLPELSAKERAFFLSHIGSK